MLYLCTYYLHHCVFLRACPDGGIGRRAGLKHQCRKASRFEPESGYTIKSQSVDIQHFGFFFILSFATSLRLNQPLLQGRLAAQEHFLRLSTFEARVRSIVYSSTIFSKFSNMWLTYTCPYVLVWRLKYVSIIY